MENRNEIRSQIVEESKSRPNSSHSQNNGFRTHEYTANSGTDNDIVVLVSRRRCAGRIDLHLRAVFWSEALE
ncbi:hypothetical protein HY417_00985 [Candidatus Kaiserbacteria bacterium]|nr:hypothetical protein [Candidatus Kaiserbacteria bacterium]